MPVSATSVPGASESVLREFKPTTVIIGGGPNTVTSSVKSRLKSITGKNAEQWYGNDRYSTASVIAGKAVDTKHWLSADAVGVAAKLPDALTGGSMVGRKNGVLLVSASDARSLRRRVPGSRHTILISMWPTSSAASRASRQRRRVSSTDVSEALRTTLHHLNITLQVLRNSFCC